MIRRGESPRLVKPNQQPVLSLGAEAARPGLSVGRGVCEPQCVSVKPISPVNFVKRKSRLCLKSQTAMGAPIW